jgi:hypothetical protein
VQIISSPTLINQQISPRIRKPASILYPHVQAENIKQHASNDEIKEGSFLACLIINFMTLWGYIWS